MKSLREQIDLKLGGKGGRKRSQEKRSVARKPLIVTPTTGVFPSSHQNTRIPTSDRDEDFEKDRHDFLSGVFHREEPNILKGTSSRLIKEDSDVPLRHVWSHSDYQDPETKEEKSNLQLIDKILVKYGSHHGRRTGNKQYQAATEYLNYHIQQDFGSKLPHGKRKQGKTASLHGREKDQASSFEQDADSFPKSYLPIAHTQDEGEDSQFNNSVKVRDVLQKAIRQHLNGSGKKSVRDSNTSSTDQQSLFDAQKMKEILVQRRAINLYQKEGAQSSKGAASAYGSQKPGMRTSPVDEITPQAEASDDQLSDDGYAKKPGFDDHDLGVPVFTCKSS
jgi:hypothetical protein